MRRVKVKYIYRLHDCEVFLISRVLSYGAVHTRELSLGPLFQLYQYLFDFYTQRKDMSNENIIFIYMFIFNECREE